MEPRKREFRLQLYARAPAPCRDYYGLTINDDTIVFNIWNISHGPHVYPKMTRSCLYDYPYNKRLQNDIARLFGTYVNEFILQLANDKVTLHCLPTRAFLCILGFLAKQDIIHLSQTSKIFFQLCQTDNVWKLIFGKILKRKPTYYEEQNAIDRGWKEVLNGKLQSLRTIHTLSAKTKNGQTQSRIKYNSLKLDSDEPEKLSTVGKAGGDASKPTLIVRKTSKQVKIPTTALKSAPKNINTKTPTMPDGKINSTSVTFSTKPMDQELYTSTLARRTLMSGVPKVKVVKSTKK